MTDTTSPTVHSTESTVLGAGVGVAVGSLIASNDMYKSAFARRHRVGYSVAAVLGMGVVGAFLGRGLSTKPNPNYAGSSPILPPPPPPPLQPVNSGTSITVSPGLTAQTVALNVQDPVVIHLPSEAQWVSMDGAPVADKTSPIAFVFLGPIDHTFVWLDVHGLQYISSYFFVVDPRSTPTTNA